MQAWTRPVLALAFLATTGCAGGAGLGAIGDILGGMAGLPGAGGGGNEIRGQVSYVDERRSEIELQSDQGQRARLSFDSRTEVVYQNQRYPVTSLENGDQVTARIQQLQNGGYYTDVVQVDRSVSGPSTMQSGNVQLLQGTVRQIDQANGLFLLDANNGSRVTVQLPQQINRADLDRFRNLRVGDFTRLYGVYLNNSRVELRQFN